MADSLSSILRYPVRLVYDTFAGPARLHLVSLGLECFSSFVIILLARLTLYVAWRGCRELRSWPAIEVEELHPAEARSTQRRTYQSMCFARIVEMNEYAHVTI
jgi:hypothetical protein